MSHVASFAGDRPRPPMGFSARGLSSPRARCFALAFVGLLTLGGCDSKRSDLREWTPEDHHNTNNATLPARGTVPAEPAPSSGNPDATDNVVLIAWKNNCALCHGLLGRGDGPQGRMLKTRDLTDPAWQTSVTDEQIQQVIRTGKGKMPAFQLPDPTLRAIVALIRKLGREPPSAAGTASATSSAEAPPPVASVPAPTPSVGGASPYGR